MAPDDTHTKSSKQEDKRYIDLLAIQAAGEIRHLKRQIEFRPLINGIEVFKYTADFAYIEGEIKVIEEFKGYIHERHDFELRMKICSAFYPDLVFRVVMPKGIYKVFKAGKAVRQKRAVRIGSVRLPA